MPSNPLNTSFVNDPLTFISHRDHAVGGHDDLLRRQNQWQRAIAART